MILLYSCSKDKPILEPRSVVPDYTPMSVGSYWVYDWYSVDTLGNEWPIGLTDSVYIAGDTIIGNDTFAIRVGTWYFASQPFREYWRDSAGYLVNPWGGISFSATNFTDTLYMSNMGQVKKYRVMRDIGEVVTVPVGTFRTLNAAYVWEKLDGVWDNCVGPYDIHDFQYAENIGMVRTSLQFTNGSCVVQEGRLRSYFIAP